MRKIDLTEVTDGGKIRNLAGKDRGVAARAHYGLDEHDKSEDSVTVEVPETLYGISSSFFLGMFSESIHKLGGRDGFLGKYKFTADPAIMAQIQHGIERCVMNRASLHKRQDRTPAPA